MFGQGNGGQGGQSDPLDGWSTTTATATTTRTQPWLGDVMFGGPADDYMEGNHGSDLMFGDDATATSQRRRDT